MTLIVSFAILVYACYTGFLFGAFGIPKSYSKTYYLLGGKVSDGWIFQVVMAILAITGAISGLDSGGDWNFLAFIPAAALLFVSAAPDFKYDKSKQDKHLENKIHMRASYIAVGGATLAIWLKFGMPLTALGYALFAIIIWLLNPKTKIFWIEHVCFDIYLILLLISTL